MVITELRIPENLKEDVDKALVKVDNFDFNVFELDGLIQKKTLYCVLTHILNKYNFIKDLLNEKHYLNFMNEVINGYDRKVIYHNDLHATEVLQTTYIMITKGDLVGVSI